VGESKSLFSASPITRKIMKHTPQSLVLFALAASTAWAQLDFTESSYDFGTRTTDTNYTAIVHLQNTGSTTLSATDIHCTPDWCTVSPASASLAPGQSINLTLTANVPHNLHYEGAVVVEGDWGAIELPLSLNGDYAGTMWDSTFNLWGSSLKSQLLSIVDGHYALSYDGARLEMYSNLDNVNGWVEGVYTGFLVQTWGIPDATIMNTEHTWPQSYGAEGDARTDLHHLFPTKSTINSSRGNLPFGEVVVSSSGYPTGGADRGTNAQGITVFEPRLQHKGDCARAMFYFALRYSNPYSFLDLANQEAVLRGWHTLDPVSQKELDRNDDIQALQQNRNPFIDEPGLLDRLGSLTGNGALVLYPDLALFPSTINLDCSSLPGCTSSFVISNPGEASLTINSIGSSNPELALNAPGTPFVLAAGEAVAVSLSGISALGSATVTVASSAGSESVAVNWAGEAPEMGPPTISIAMEENGYRITWDAVPGAEQYRIQYASNVNGPWLNLGLTSQTQYLLAGTSWPSPSLLRVTSVNSQ
jgi:deoxyribonuclease-1